MKYSDYFIEALVEQGYTHCFFVGGGNILHLLESARIRMECVAVINEVTAGIAAEYFNVANRGTGNRAFALVTAGPGLTNMVTSIAGAWLESRELLVVGGQARSNSLARGVVRQLGHQEIDGVAIVKPITKVAQMLEFQISKSEIHNLVRQSFCGRKGPVFLEVCLDVTAQTTQKNLLTVEILEVGFSCGVIDFDLIAEMVKLSSRPLLLIGGGLEFQTFQSLIEKTRALGIPIATTWNASDYLDYDDPLYAGRPNTYGMRWANGFIQQSDLLIVFGTRLSFWETGFNYKSFLPNGKIIHIDIDSNELNKNNLEIELKVNIDSNVAYRAIISDLANRITNRFDEWTLFLAKLKKLLPINELVNQIDTGYINPFTAIEFISEQCTNDDKIVICSSGGTYTTAMQVFKQKIGQLLTNNKGLASMGYGLAGAIGTSLAFPNNRVILFEGDGGFSQNLGDLGTVALRKLNIKIFLFSNNGFASIRISQKTNFNGSYIGCDPQTGIGLPQWRKLFAAFEIPIIEVSTPPDFNDNFFSHFESCGPVAFIIEIDTEQAFYPKISSSTLQDGQIVSNPLHLMTPELSIDKCEEVFPFLDQKNRTIKNFQKQK